MRAAPAAATAHTAPTIPRWITFFAGFLALLGLMAAAQQYLQPASLYPGLPLDLPAALAVAGAAGARSLAQALALGLALLLRARSAVGVLLMMRALTEVQDLAIGLTRGTAPMPPAVMILVFAVLIGLELFAAFTLLRHRGA